MTPVGIVCDSVTGLSEKSMLDNGLKVVSMGFVSENKLYRDFVDIRTEEFWKIFPTFKETPTTSACSTGDFRRVFIDLARDTNEIVCITISDKLSATHKAARQAADIMKEERPQLDIRVINSQTSSGGLGWIVLEAARAARAGKSQAEIVSIVNNMIGRSKYFIALESMKYLMKIARAPQNPGQPLPPQFSPIMGIVKPDSGVMENLDRAPDIDAALSRMTDMVKNYIRPDQPVHFIFSYPDGPQKCVEVEAWLSQKYHCAEIIHGQWPPSALVAVGPMYGLGFYA